jgi:hypothetical protein
MSLRDLHGDPERLLLEEADEELRDDLEHSRRHGPVVGDDPSVEYELVSPELRRRYREAGAFS